MPRTHSDSGETGADLSIGDLATQTGVKSTTLRSWEERFGFPIAVRRASGHRRYPASAVTDVHDVLMLRDGGIRLGSAIEQVLSREVPETADDQLSVFSALRSAAPVVPVRTLRMPTLLALSWAVEDEFLARNGRAHIFGCFQQQRHYERARARWGDLAQRAESTFVFADFDKTRDPADTRAGSQSAPIEVALTPDSPMLREWAVICDDPALPCAVVAWQLPGQQHRPSRDRMFEAIWTLDPRAVRVAARSSARVAQAANSARAEEVAAELAAPAAVSVPEMQSVTALVNRVLTYVDAPPR